MSLKSTPNAVEGRVKTLAEVASLLRISRGSAYEAAKRREIPTIRIGRRILVPTVALDKLLGEPANPRPDYSEDRQKVRQKGEVP